MILGQWGWKAGDYRGLSAVAIVPLLIVERR